MQANPPQTLDAPTPPKWNIYCHESCHLPHDRQPALFLGALPVPLECVKPLTKTFRAILFDLGLPISTTLKWSKVSPSGLKFYEAALDFFASEPGLDFYIVAAQKTPPPVTKCPKPPPVPPDGDYDRPEWQEYYNLCETTAGAAVDYLLAYESWSHDRYLDLLRLAVKPAAGRHTVYLNIKNTRGGTRIRTLEKQLASTQQEGIEAIRQIASREILLSQLADIILGAFSRLHNPANAVNASPAKRTLAEKIRNLIENHPEKIKIKTQGMQ
jgi:hypothetical protein